MGLFRTSLVSTAGAKVFGFGSHWLNRSGAPAEELGATPDATLRSINDLANLMKY